MDEISLAEELGDEFADLQKEFLDTTHDRVTSLARLLEEAAGQIPAGEHGDEFRRIAHSVRGSGGSYGFTVISAVAGELEKAYLGGETARRLAELVEGLEAALVNGRERALGTGR